MAIYAIGDIQGCFEALQRLLQKVSFDATQDQLWLAGDLVNRGPQSLEVLRFVKDLGHHAKVVLGNHDLHLLAIHYGGQSVRHHDTLTPILSAPDRDELLDWLRFQPLVQLDEGINWCMSHAGIPPRWSVRKARRLAQEVEAVLQSPQCADFFRAMYGNLPDRWQKGLTGQDRLRTIVNYLTRMRFVGDEQQLDLTSKEGVGTAPEGFMPWFEVAGRKACNNRLLFGHWAALEGKVTTDNVYALDTGCVWGGQLSALRLDDQQWFRVPAQPEETEQ
ncbi:symmetrical bis(5'-nucleosyl)-tetraphosphatase [Thalassolituus marinus]|uniref:Bis(5'-nucleosyl)-tetraphosphatase, symmetrical n=1 Tax=Thalassolituus marinus TaxID=671053 RepID=A0ABS7ZUJ1_9GAMM|nr:symmetrical bis(5'-nucleosyl)-tetraphosphatase [Thalassolituus marinus]MCA6064230.1 symmetrical bis(5'-nucleosyl)-tetraphosphatase [Thalassolituus marinus]